MGIVLAVAPDAANSSELFAGCMSPEFVRPLLNVLMWNTGLVSQMITANMLPESHVRKLASGAELYKEDEVTRGLFFNSMLALGSPSLGDSVGDFAAKFLLPHNDKGAVFQAARNALLGNPLIQKQKTGLLPDGDGSSFYYKNLATFGDLSYKDAQSQLARLLAFKAESIGEKTGPVITYIRQALLSRSDLPKKLIFALDESPTATLADYRKLVQMEGHQALVRKCDLNTFKSMTGQRGEESVCSPVATEIVIERQFKASPKRGTVRDSLLLAAQCPEWCYQVGRQDNPRFLDTLAFLNSSPWARHYLRENSGRNVGRILAANEAAGIGLSVLSVAAMPFEFIQPVLLRERFDDEARFSAACVAGVIRSREFAAKLSDSDIATDAADLAFLFSPATSGKQLEKIASRQPNLAAIAACHPNGNGVPTDGLTDHEAEVVARHREHTILVGRGAGQSSIPSCPLVL